jgi:hypothetical protein
MLFSAAVPTAARTTVSGTGISAALTVLFVMFAHFGASFIFSHCICSASSRILPGEASFLYKICICQPHYVRNPIRIPDSDIKSIPTLGFADKSARRPISARYVSDSAFALHRSESTSGWVLVG